MRTDLEERGVDGEGDRFLFLGVECTLRRRDSKPIGYMLDGELTGHAGGIGDEHGEAMGVLIIHEVLHMTPLIPDDAIEVRIDGPHHG